MSSEAKLPYRVISRAADLFGGAFSKSEMGNFFRYELNDEYASPPAGTNSKDLFRSWMTLFPLEVQKRLLHRLCTENLSMYFGRPKKEDLASLLSMIGTSPLQADSFVGKLTSITVHEEWQKAQERIQADPDGAVTSAKALLEATCKRILDDKGIAYGVNPDLPPLYKLTAENLNLHPSQHIEQVFKEILSGGFKIVKGMAEMRNLMGDAHGKGAKKIKPDPRHAELAVNMAGGISAFLIATHEARVSQATP